MKVLFWLNFWWKCFVSLCISLLRNNLILKKYVIFLHFFPDWFFFAFFWSISISSFSSFMYLHFLVPLLPMVCPPILVRRWLVLLFCWVVRPPFCFTFFTHHFQLYQKKNSLQFCVSIFLLYYFYFFGGTLYFFTPRSPSRRSLCARSPSPFEIRLHCN